MNDFKTASKKQIDNTKHGKAAFLWDESFLWGIMALNAFDEAGLDYELVRSADIKEGCLKKGYCALFVPGGWASNKIKVLGEEGCSNIREFVAAGGNYIGFCGGAGLATSEELGLLNVTRKSTKERVPSFSGPISLSINENFLWQNIDVESKSEGVKTAVFNVWWPSQFVIAEPNDIEILATYGEAMPESYSSDVCVGNIRNGSEWKQVEHDYGINLNPGKMYGDPAVIMGDFGKGKVILSLVHFDTPGDKNGIKVLNNLGRLTGINIARGAAKAISAVSSVITHENPDKTNQHNNTVSHNTHKELQEIEQIAKSILDMGLQEKLWFWRNSMLLQWRRGVRGLEYCNLYIMAQAINTIGRNRTSNNTVAANRAGAKEAITANHNHETAIGYHHSQTHKETESILDGRTDLLENMKTFRDKAIVLLPLEASLIKSPENPGISYKNCNDQNVTMLRTELFGTAKSHGGLFKTIINMLDDVLYEALKIRSL
jgi:glutamine amidotransferase-like uncharacterized protein